MTLAPAVATIHEMQRLNLIERSSIMGEYLGEKLRQLAETHPSVGNVRGLGLFWAVDLVKNRETKEPMNSMAEKLEGRSLMVDQVAAEMMKNGVAVQPWISHLVLAPPLIIEHGDIDLAMTTLNFALDISDRFVEA